MKKINYYNKGRQEIVIFIPKSIRRVLDIGCGEGAFLKILKQQTKAETWGIEVEGDIAKIAQGQIDHIVVGKAGEVLDLIPNYYFDCITFNDVLEHIEEPLILLKMVKQKLSENGIIIASIPNVRYYSTLYGLLIKKDWEYKEEGILDSTHLRFFTKKSMVRLFEAAGYFLVKQKGINKTNSLKFKIFNILTLGIFNDTKYLQFVCVAKT